MCFRIMCGHDLSGILFTKCFTLKYMRSLLRISLYIMDCLDVGIHVDTALSAETIYIFYDI